MSGYHATARLDDRGRLVLPKELRRRLGLRPGDEVTISEQTDGALRLESRRMAARALIGSAGRTSRSMAQELGPQVSGAREVANVPLVHDDRDYDRIAAVTGQDHVWSVADGALAGPR